MARVAVRRRRLPFPGALRGPVAIAVLALAGLVALSLYLRTRQVGVGFWIDEGLSVGIASHSWLDIPGTLRQDGSPPLYYLLLHVWMQVFGDGEARTHGLSLLFALLTVPAGLWAGWSLFDRRTGLVCACVAALNPFLTLYAQETRMYSLVVLLSLVGTAAFLNAFVFARRRYLPLFAGALAALVLTHNWGLFFGVATVLALVPLVRGRPDSSRVVRDACLVYGAVALVYLPWLPSLVYQALHTGAPWAQVPGPDVLPRSLVTLVSGEQPGLALLLAGGAGLAALLGPSGVSGSTRRRAVVTVLVIAVGTLVTAWLASQVSPAWANRYLAVVLGPLMLLIAMGLAHSGRLGLVGLALVAIFWLGHDYSSFKSSAREMGSQLERTLRPGDLVISTHPEQVPLLHYYLPQGARYATPLGPVKDPRVMDWRDALSRMKVASPEKTLSPLLATLPAGRRLLLVRPVIGRTSGWKAPWTRLVRGRAAQWGRALERDKRFVRSAAVPVTPGQSDPRGVRGLIFTKTKDG